MDDRNGWRPRGGRAPRSEEAARAAQHRGRRGLGDPEPEPDRVTPPPTPLLDPERIGAYQRLHERRIVFLRGPIQDQKADDVVAQLLELEADADEPVTLYIDSPGGDTFGMFAIHDVMQMMRAPVHTRCVGMAASAGAFLLATGTGTRSATENARIMIHQPLGGGQGTASDIEILAREFVQLRERMEQLLAERTGQPIEQIHRDTQRDFWLSAEEALAYGLIDEVARATPRRRLSSTPRP
jgi:ATP-dependent Clp protease, protease subunit